MDTRKAPFGGEGCRAALLYGPLQPPGVDPQGHHVPPLFRQSLKDNGRRPSTIASSLPGELLNLEHVCWSPMATSDNTQIYEGTNQV